VLLAIVCLLLHGGALEGGFKYDDAPHLRFASDYSPLEYFTSADVMREQSYAHITPMLSLAFDAAIALGGLDSRIHYLLHLSVLWAVAASTWWLLSRWLSGDMAFAAAALFLAMPPTAWVANTLMTTHYAWGLLFSVLALCAWARAIAATSVFWAVTSALLYGLACLGKELYVPLVLVMLLWPGLGWRRGARLASPAIIVALAYLALRYHVLGGVGGYGAISADTQAKLAGVPDRVWFLFRDSLGDGWMGATNAVVLVAAIAIGWRGGRRLNVPFALGAAISLLLPVAPLLLINTPYGIHRTMIFVGWTVAVLAAWSLEGARSRLATLAILAAMAIALTQASALAVRALEVAQRVERAENDLVARGAPGTDLVPNLFRGIGYLEQMRTARRNVEGVKAPSLVTSFEELAALGTERGRHAMAWNEACACVRPLGAAYDEMLARAERGASAGRGLPLHVRVRLEDLGRTRALEWSVHGSAGTVYLEVGHSGRYDIGPEGRIVFGLDTTVMLPPVVPIRVVIETADGAIVRSPWLDLRMSGTNEVQWSSGSGAPR
jgi:hypothetical protein